MKASLRVLGFFCLACALWPGAASAQLPETEVASRLTADTTEFLNRMLGPGRAKVLVLVEGNPFQKEGFQIGKMRVSVVLDARLPDSQVQEVRRLLPDFLQMNTQRGDDITVLRAPLVPQWKAAFSDAHGARTLGVIAAVLALGLAFCLTLYLTGVGAMRAFAREFVFKGALRGEAPLPAAEVEPLMLRGEIPGLLEEGLAAAAREEAAPGRRFDFLAGKEPRTLGRLLEGQPPEDMALLFSHLADSDPELAARAFLALPAERQGPVTQALARLSVANPERLAEIESRLRAAFELDVRGGERLSRILSRLPLAQREVLLGDLQASDPASAQAVEESLFTFEGLAQLQPEDLRRLIVSVPFQDWGCALRSAPQELAAKILSELPALARAMVEESLQNSQPRDKVLASRSKILAQADVLREKGQIAAERPGSEPERL